jgi:hypothetical protein
MHSFNGSLGNVRCNLSAFDCHFCNNGIHLHHGSSSSALLILTIQDFVLDDILIGEGATKGSKTKSGKT